MAFLLFAILVSFSIWIYISKRDIFHPAFLISICYCFSSLFVVLNRPKLDGDISILTVAIISVSLLAFAIPCLVVDNRTKIVKKEFSPLFVNIWIKLFFAFFLLIVNYFYFLYIVEMARKGGYSGGVKNIFTFAQIAIYGDEVDASMNLLLNYGLKIARGIGYFVCFEVVQNIVFRKKYKFNKYGFIISMLNVLLYLVQCVLSTGRTQLFYYLIFALAIYIFLDREKNGRRINNKKYVKIIIPTAIIGIIAFRLIGVEFRGSIYGTTTDAWDSLSKYIGGPIIALDKYLNNPTHSSFFGEETLYSMYSVFNKLGFDYKANATNLDFVTYLYNQSTISINVYGAIRRYIHDYYYFAFIIVAFEGIAYGLIYNKIKRVGSNTFLFLFYSKSIYPLIFFFFEERVLTDVLTASNFLTILVFYLLYLSFKRKRMNASSAIKTKAESVAMQRRTE